jgi:hypothetical protein
MSKEEMSKQGLSFSAFLDFGQNVLSTITNKPQKAAEEADQATCQWALDHSRRPVASLAACCFSLLIVLMSALRSRTDPREFPRIQGM